MKNIKSLLSVFAMQAGNYLFPIVTIPIVSRVFGPSLIGDLNYYVYIVTFFCLVVEYGFGYSAVRELTRNPDCKSDIFTRTLISKSFLLIFSTLVAIFIASRSDVDTALFIGCYVLVLNSYFNITWFLQSTGKVFLISILSILSKVVSLFLVVFTVKDKSDLVYYSYVVNVPIVLISIFSFLYFLFVFRIRIDISSKSIKEGFLNLVHSFWLFASKIAATLYTTAGVVILGYLSTSYDVGLYTSAQKIIGVFISLMSMPLSLILFPVLSKRISSDLNEGIGLFKRIFPLLIMVCLASFLFIIFFSDKIVSLLLGEQFKECIPLLNILSVGFVFLFLGIVIGGQVILNLGYDRQFVIMQVFVGVISLIFSFLFLKQYGAKGLAVIWSSSEGVILIMQFIFIYKKGVFLLDINNFKPGSILKTTMEIIKK